MGSDPAKRGQPVHPGHHDVEEDQLGRIDHCFVDGLPPILSSVDFISLEFEVDLDDLENVRIVVDHENPFAHSGIQVFPPIIRRSPRIASTGSGAPKTDVPATKTVAPAFLAEMMLSDDMPPSISISAFRS